VSFQTLSRASLDWGRARRTAELNGLLRYLRLDVDQTNRTGGRPVIRVAAGGILAVAVTLRLSRFRDAMRIDEVPTAWG
jgi:hypothetical protein